MVLGDYISRADEKQPNDNQLYERVVSSVPNRSAHSLLETIVVTGIIAILVGLLSPALYAARERAKRTECSSNLSQIGLAIKAYAEDNNEYHPWSGLEDGQAYQDLYPKYTPEGEVFLCPSDSFNHIYCIDNWQINQDNSVFASYIAENYNRTIEYAIRESDPVESMIFWDLFWSNDEEREEMNHGLAGGNALHLGGHVRWYENTK
ncbi:MAG: DUF1559 domain-containing protein [Candidatus Woesearchaeota archaeon]